MTKTKIYTLSAVALATAIGAASLWPAFAANDHTRMQGQGPAAQLLEMDINKDGKITADEMKAAAAERFAATDTNGDGFLSKDEMLAAATLQIHERMAKRIDKMMSKLDSDGDGKISVAEAETNPRMEHMMARLDTDGDGAISAEELAAMQGKGWGHGKKHHTHDE